MAFNIAQRTEASWIAAKLVDYRDQGLSDDEIAQRIARGWAPFLASIAAYSRLLGERRDDHQELASGCTKRGVQREHEARADAYQQALSSLHTLTDGEFGEPSPYWPERAAS